MIKSFAYIIKLRFEFILVYHNEIRKKRGGEDSLTRVIDK